MKFAAVIAILFQMSAAMAQPAPDTVVRSVAINFQYNKLIFPDSWQRSPINADGGQIDELEIPRCKKVLITALRKYPLSLLQEELQSVYFVKWMKFYNVGYGGTNSIDALYLTDNGVDMGYTELYLEQTFHHEFSSILYRNHPSLLNEKAWLSANMAGFKYNDPESGVGAIRNNQSSQELDTNLCVKGFLTQYSQSGMENDINTFAQNVFCPTQEFWTLVDNYPRIALKFSLMIIFYNSINPVFTETYFRRLTHQN